MIQPARPAHSGQTLAERFERERNSIAAHRRVLMVMPRFPVTFWGLDYAFRDILAGPRYPLPPLSLLTLATFLPPAWEVRVADENVRPITEDDWAWADVLMINAMIVQAGAVERLTREAHARGLPVAMGGPHPTIAPQDYPEADYVHCGEVGDATIDLWQAIAKEKGRPPAQRMFLVNEKIPLQAYPPPRYDLIRARDYLSLSLQFAVGCPFNCEFCDIIEIYGRSPRVKEPVQILAELDGLRASGHRGSVFFVDDNFIGNLPKVKALLPHLIAWQERHGHPFQFYTEASVNLAEHPGLLRDMQRAGFYAVFLGIETPDPKALQATQKSQNARRPLPESLRILQDHGLEIWAGFILGFDTDTPQSGDGIVDFIDANAIPVAMVNLLNAPAGTQLWRRMKAEGRLFDRPPIGDNVTDTNMRYALGQEETFAMFRRAWERLYEPHAYLARIRRNIARTGAGARRLGRLVPWRVKLASFPKVLWQMGVRAPYRRSFWKLLAWSCLHGHMDAFMFQMGFAHHCIRFRERILSERPAGEALHMEDEPAKAAQRPELAGVAD